MKRTKTRLVAWNKFVYSKIIIELIINDSLEDFSDNRNYWNWTGSINPAFMTNKDAYMIYGDMNIDTRSLQAAGFRKKTRSKMSASSACFVGQM